MRITPWRSRSELEQLKQWLFVDDTPASKRRAIQRIDAYLTRGPYLPHIIEYTVRLMQCQLNDPGEAQDGDDMEYLKWQYCMVLIRFVNGMLDPVQQAQFAIPLHTLAENIGLPSWFVELRHLSTHERELPSLEMLRLCCKEAIQWTWDNYWNNDEWEEEDQDFDEAEDEDATDDNDDSEAKKRKSQSSVQLKSLFTQYTGLKRLLKENEYLWKRQRIARSTFGEQDSTEDEEVSDWLTVLKTAWKQIHKSDFVEYMILHCDETLLEICFHSLDTFQVRCIEWLIENYEKRIMNEETKITDRFSNHKKLLKFVNKCCSMVNGRKFLSNGLFSNVVDKYHNYLVLHILKNLSNESGSSGNYSGSKSRKKKKANEIDAKKVIEEFEAKGIRNVELELYNSRKRTSSEEIEPVSEDSPALDILKDLNELKNQFKKIKQSNAPISNWQEVTEWTPRPFGVL
ncbi:rRNA-processing protein LAS1 [Kluyveromyces lactis]|uniref:KLLA0A06017p n=1 Tax=Kluyveromyces lactis (strain ATCC 8585 / CBS 2359 / DSM 70799 / NBRC 1267 / NRRL Y-1140 / WM37) TaxID=284590 RepID=Q6CXS1_KLULA|nr:uncharacterized protein KLLA0_A06017g [Kluyveromyces lactis]CAH02856.1 KLLA0A06017p [Kluyveromyces lactis]|eukprot:XP_451268.1 uncharacterized protein KLLA0_A06017g [Kluyveromyces lactis]